MKGKFLAALAPLMIASALYGAQPREKAETMLRQQNAQCRQLMQYAKSLHTQKDIPTLLKIRRQLRRVLVAMEADNLQLRKLPTLDAFDDQLLSIDEGIRRMENLAEEPMNRSNLQEVQALCRFISMLDGDILASLRPSGVYQAAR